MNYKNILAKAIAAGTTLLAANSIYADDILKGTRGPTNFQLDLRENYTQRSFKDTTTTSTTNNDVIKYWSGDNLGAFGFINIPAYKTVDNESSSREGFGDIGFGLGPRGKVVLPNKDSINFLSYVGAVLPTGDDESIPALGNGRTDYKTGIFATYLTADKKFDVDGSFEYTFAGENSGIKGLDEIAAGAIVGARLTDDNLVRAGAGIQSRLKEDRSGDWDYVYGPRAVVRITPPKSNWHFELMGDYDCSASKMSRGFSLTAQLRINLGK